MSRCLAACSLTLLLVGALRAASSTGSLQPLTASTQREPVNTTVPTYRAYVEAGGDKFSFLVPEGFRLGGDAAHGKLEINNTDSGFFIAFSITAPVTGGGEDYSREGRRGTLSRRYATGKIVQEFTRPVLGRNCQAFDIAWQSAGNLAQKTRVVYVPTNAGMLEVSLTSGANQFRQAEAGLNQVLGSLSASVDGKLTIHHLANVM